ncbi:DUF4105 domain-containing protein [Pigmentibacter sp. JX0631]|uniref:Lnb N-terminal periplasmic domain-containing protein n=1 Tax=Pigmentibacter sp. JX0631 TaxID=2976982 RepID=UPI0024695D8F|nr:DUF4105 domain-containing protein [Pigmentibacter sp. JX0631]WGL60039.1 DUF4105 domain-containing protein [Pigmentibacter sp. JX0631]
MSFGIKIFFIIITLLQPLSLFALNEAKVRSAEKYFIDKSRNLSLAETSEWRKILFFQHKLFSSAKGIVDGKDFYLAEDGKINLQTELEATIKAFLSDTESKNSAHCKFPRRLKWLKSHLDDNNYTIPVQKCNELEKWLEFVNPNGAVLVFSSFYINNPSSMFGHTFLRIKNSSDPLTDSGINFAANPDTSNILAYTYKGLTGMFEGKFSLLPYSIKVQEYNNSESRDIWEYELNLSKEQTINMLLSLWEVGDNRIDYYYIDENCSYILLALLDTANDNFNFASKFWLWVNPSDTLRVVYSYPNLIKSVTFRPSAEKRFRYRYTSLNKEEKKLFNEILDQKKVLLSAKESNSKISSAKVLDAITEYIDFKENLAGTEESKKYPIFRKQLLTSRAELGVISDSIKIDPSHSDRPEKGLPGGRIGGSYSHSYYLGNLFDLEIYPVLHSIESPSLGYSREAQIELLSGSFRYEAVSKQIYVNKLDLVNIVSIPSINPPLYPVAWNLRLGMKQDYDCDKNTYNSSCATYFFSGGAGAAILTEPFQFYFLPQAEFSYQNTNAFEVSLGALSGVTLKTSDSSLLSSKVNWMKRYSVLYSTWRDHFLLENSFSIQYFTNFQNKLFYNYNFFNHEWQAGLSVYWHFY